MWKIIYMKINPTIWFLFKQQITDDDGSQQNVTLETVTEHFEAAKAQQYEEILIASNQ